MRLLFLTQLLPYPPDSGGKIKAFNLLRHLASQQQVTLVSFIRNDTEMDNLPALAPYCTDVRVVKLNRSRAQDFRFLAASLLRSIPFLVLRDCSIEMTTLVQNVVHHIQPDLLHAVQLNMAQYALLYPDIPKVLDQENVVSLVVERVAKLERPGLRKLLAMLEWRKLRRYEAETCTQFDHILAVTEEDKAALSALIRANRNLLKGGDQPPITAVPIGIDTQDIQPVQRRADARSILFTGSMVWPPNSDGISWFTETVFPQIRTQLPDVQLIVIGRQPPETVRAAMRRFPDNVAVTGYVDDLTPYLEQAAVFIVPLRAAGGMRVKILDAFAWGIPVVSTSIGCEGIAVTPGRNILIADHPEDFAREVIRVIHDRNLAAQLMVEGRRLVETQYDWRIVYRKIDEVYASVMTAGG
jgi:sugar transferase (PEP-CTERM/EpsH1 system associated)